jgi:membrane-bound lytic murein transglycosylase D
MPSKKLVAAPLFILLCVACSHVQPRTTPEAPVAAETPAVHENGDGDAGAPAAARQAVPDEGTPQDRVRAVMDQIQELYGAGLEAHKAGRFDEARDYFDQAVEAALDSNLEIDSEPELQRAYEELLENIDALEGDLYQDGSQRGEEPPKEELKEITSYLSPEEAERERRKVESAVREVVYDVPVVLNTQVLTFIETFQTRLRDQFEGGLRRSGLYLEMIKQVFAEEGIPTDLAYMAHQESAFKTSAYSRAKAKGLWQFIGPTGRKYGLRRDEWVDERSDPEKSTRAAAAYLKDLYAMFGDWYLAMAAYNAGEGKVMRSMRRTGATDFWSLARHRRVLRTETRNYVPAILASIIIDKAPEQYGFEVELEDPLEYETHRLDSPTDLRVIAECAGTTVEEIRRLNPELRTMATPPYTEGYTIKIPSGTSASFGERYAAIPKEERLKWIRHVVRKGETLSRIAARYGASVPGILSANQMRSANRLRIGQVLIIPTSGYVPAKVTRAQYDRDQPTYDRGEKVTHRVRRGETLGRIASRYRTTVHSLRSWNNLSGTHIRAGQRLVVYYGGRAESPVEAADPFQVASASGEYRVRKGDTLYSIARRFGMTVEELREVNNLGRSSVIRPGDRLRVVPPDRGESPAAGPTAQPSSTRVIQYRIRRGDTLERIAVSHGVRVGDLVRWNNIDSADQIHAGRLLQIHLD